MKMSKMMEKLQSFLPRKAYAKISEDGENTFEIMDAETDEEIGYFSLNENGELMRFSFREDTSSGNVSKMEILNIAEKFINTFYPGQKEYELSAILDLNHYMVVYERRDEKYGLFLHSTGFSVSVHTSGQITGFYLEDEEFEVRYSDMLVTEEAALEKYVSGLDFDLTIQQFNQEIFKNGDNQYHLAYSVIERVMDIPAGGSESTSIIDEQNMELKIPELKVPENDIYELIGITSEYRLLGKQVEEGKRIEVWSKSKSFHSFLFDMDEPDNHAINLCFDDRTGVLLQISSGEAYKSEGAEIGLESAMKQAVQVMFKLYPNTHEKFRLETPKEADEFANEETDFAEEMYEEELELDDEYIVYEPTYLFYFHLHHKGLQVNQHGSHIGVGRYTGKITHFHLDIPSDDLIEKLQLTPVITLQEAKEIYKNCVQIELRFIREFDENGKSIYSLTYTPTFPTTVGHVRAIDAVTGKAMYMNVGDAMFLS